MNFKAVSASEAVRLVGLKSVAMLDYLERSEVLVKSARRASGRGRHRAYDFRDLLVLKVIWFAPPKWSFGSGGKEGS